MIVAGCSQVCIFVGFLPRAFNVFGLFKNDETSFLCPLTSLQRSELEPYRSRKLHCDFNIDSDGLLSLDYFEIYRDEETTTDFLDRKISEVCNEN